MTVAILLSDPQTQADESFYVPVAGQSTFTEFWVPAAESLGLFWMPLFETGVPISWARIPIVRQEFVATRDWFDTNIRDRGLADFLTGRANLAIAGLDQIMARPDEVELFIG
jgi:hypothetical protein